MIIGSVAVKNYLPSTVKFRTPNDLDLVFKDAPDVTTVTAAQYWHKGYRLEIHKNPVLINWMAQFPEYRYNLYLPLDELLTLKMSHCFWDLHNTWSKHMYDIQLLLEHTEAKFIPELFYQLYDYWNTVHPPVRRSNLEMSANDFFNNAITFKTPHDDVHKILCQHPYFDDMRNIPTYLKVLKDGAEVAVSEEKFNNLTEKEKFNLVFEEVAVMGVERFKGFYKEIYGKMMKKFIMNHAPLWEAIWIIKNHKKLMTQIPFDFVTHFKKEGIL